MSEFDKWFEGEMPNSHKKVNKERIETVIYSCAEAAWEHQQAKIDELQKRVDELKGNVNNALGFYNYAKSDVNIGMIKMKQLLRGEE